MEVNRKSTRFLSFGRVILVFYCFKWPYPVILRKVRLRTRQSPAKIRLM
jgi:hypothetical protein